MATKKGITPKFTGTFNGKPKPRQPIATEDVLKTQKQAKRRLSALLADIYATVDGLDKVITGPNKRPWVAELKAARDYEDDMSFVCDFVRGKAVGNTVEQAKAVYDILSNSNHPLMRKHGILAVTNNNFFEDPKEPTAYRVFNFKLAVPVKLEDGTFNYQVCEVIYSPKQIEDIYNLTHPYKAKYEEIYDNAKGRELTPEEQDAARFCQLNLWLMNSYAAQEYNSLLKPELLEKYTIDDEIKELIEAEIILLAAKIKKQYHPLSSDEVDRSITLIPKKKELRYRHGAHDHNGKTTFTRASYAFPDNFPREPQPADFIGRNPALIEVFDFARNGWFPVKDGGIKLITSVNHEFMEPDELAGLQTELNNAIIRYNEEHPGLDRS